MSARYIKLALCELSLARLYLDLGAENKGEYTPMHEDFTCWDGISLGNGMSSQSAKEAFNLNVCFCGLCADKRSPITKFHEFFSLHAEGNTAEKNRNASGGILLSIIVSMNRENAAATRGDIHNQYYWNGRAFRGPQASWVFTMFRDGYFQLDNNGKLIINIP